MPDNADNAVNANKFVCVGCDFRCSKQSNYETHLLTYKHQKIMGIIQSKLAKMPIVIRIIVVQFVQLCEK